MIEHLKLIYSCEKIKILKRSINNEMCDLKIIWFDEIKVCVQSIAIHHLIKNCIKKKKCVTYIRRREESNLY